MTLLLPLRLSSIIKLRKKSLSGGLVSIRVDSRLQIVGVYVGGRKVENYEFNDGLKVPRPLLHTTT